jgi:3-dehydroquinate dehydratase-2
MTQPAPKSLRILIAHGVNLDLLGKREPHIYGSDGLAEIEALVRRYSPVLAQLSGLPDPSLHFYQSNHEGAFLDKLSEGWDGALINAGAWTHTSLALADRLVGLGLPFVEVHLSNLARREEFRHHSYAAPHAKGVCYGLGLGSYVSGLSGLYFQLAILPKS